MGAAGKTRNLQPSPAVITFTSKRWGALSSDFVRNTVTAQDARPEALCVSGDTERIYQDFRFLGDGLDDVPALLFETDFDGEGGGSNSVTSGFSGGKGFGPVSTVFNRQLDTLGTVRGRVGYAVAPDQLWYITSGLAYGQTKFGATFTCGACKPSPAAEASTSIQTSNTLVGWTLGAGIEWKFLPAWSLKAEYLYIDIGNPSNTLAYNYAKHSSTLTSTANERDNVARIGINYKLF
jgi:outer membrane immunogenic protein